MMDALEFSGIAKAHSALSLILAGDREMDERARVKAFGALAVAFALAEPGYLAESIEASPNPTVRLLAKSGAFNLGAWAGDARELAAAFIGSITEGSVLDLIGRYATALPIGQKNCLIATGTAASNTGEGDLKAIRHPGLNAGDVQPTKVAALIVLTRELARFGGEFQRILEGELRKSVLRATNAAVLAALVDSGTAVVGIGTDPLETLRAGLLAMGATEGAVIAAPASACAWLSTHEAAGPGFGLRGGEFRPGIHLIGIDDAASWTFIPASRLAVRDWGLELRSGEHASVSMADTPEANTEVVSLFQTNSIALIGERNFLIGGDMTGVVVASGS